MVIKLFIHIQFKWVEKYCCFLDWISHNARWKNQRRINSWIFKIKPPSIFHIFQIHIRQSTTKITISPNSQMGYHSTLPRINLFKKKREEYYMDNNYHTRWLSTIHKNNPSSSSWLYHENDSTTGQKESMREKRVYSKTKSSQRVLCFIFDRGCAIIYRIIEVL